MLGFLTLLYNHVITQLLGESSLPIFAVIAYPEPGGLHGDAGHRPEYDAPGQPGRGRK